MPILAAETDQFPESLFAEPAADRSADRMWWVLHTRPRQEKCLARQLLETRVPFFLPLIPRRSRVRGRMMTSYNPLFTSYVFLFANHNERISALSTHRVVLSLKVADQEQLWHDLGQIRRLIDSGAPITPEDQLQSGMAVEIRSGPLAGLKGKIIRTASGRRFVVQVDFIQRGASVELDDFMLVKTN
jgi:transcriptional antiterminator RfaH